MSTQAQILANQANAQKSTGPRTEAGKAASSQNRFRHGLTGPFVVLGWESQEDYRQLLSELFHEHQPESLTEELLVTDMAQSHWLRKRAITLQNMCFNGEIPMVDQPKELALYLRYQNTHDRAFYKALNQLLKLRADKRKKERDEAASCQRAEDLKIGFVSQERKQAQEKRREAEENRRQEVHQARVQLVQAQTRRHETETTIAEVLRMPRSTPAKAA